MSTTLHRSLVLTLLLAAVAFHQASAQTNDDGPPGFRVSGTLRGDDGSVVAFANVLLMHAADSVVAEAALSDVDGAFALTADSGRYFLQAVMLGYDDY